MCRKSAAGKARGISGLTASPTARGAWAKRAAAADLVTRTDPHIGGLFTALNEAVGGFGAAANAR